MSVTEQPYIVLSKKKKLDETTKTQYSNSQHNTPHNKKQQAHT